MTTRRAFAGALRSAAWGLLIVVLLLGGPALAPARATPAAPAVDITLCRGQSVQQGWDVFVPRYPQQADILLAVDTTGDMAGPLENLRASFIGTILPGVLMYMGDTRWGVVEFKDYELFGNADPPFPYRLVQGFTANAGAVQAALDGLTAVGGGDVQEAYARALYESDADPAVQWRPGARRFVVMYGNSLPHEPDPGRDGVLGTADDLTMWPVLAGMRAQNITLLYVNSGDAGLTTWWHMYAGWAGAGGDAQTIAPTGAGLAAATIDLILLASREIDAVALATVPPEYATWLATSPTSYTNLIVPDGGITLSFGITLTLPATVTLGHDYMFDLQAVGDGIVFGTRPETIHPRGCAYVPLCQFGVPPRGARPGP